MREIPLSFMNRREQTREMNAKIMTFCLFFFFSYKR